MVDNDFDFDAWEDHINAYLNHKMTVADRTQFEQAMGEVEGLKEAVDIEATLTQKAREHQLFEHLKPKIEAYIDEKGFKNTGNTDNTPPKPTKGPLSINRFLGILGVVLVGILAWLGYNSIQKSNSKTQLRTQLQTELVTKWLTNQPLAYENTNLAAFQTGADSAALAFYKVGKYNEAEALFKQNDSKEVNISGPRGLYRAVNALMTNPANPKMAINLLEIRYFNRNTFKYEAVAWYLALAYLQNGDFEKSKQVLKDITLESEYFGKAQTLMRELEDF